MADRPDPLDEKARQIVQVYLYQSGINEDEYTQRLESMIRVALKEIREQYRPRYTSPIRYG